MGAITKVTRGEETKLETRTREQITKGTRRGEEMMKKTRGGKIKDTRKREEIKRKGQKQRKGRKQRNQVAKA